MTTTTITIGRPFRAPLYPARPWTVEVSIRDSFGTTHHHVRRATAQSATDAARATAEEWADNVRLLGRSCNVVMADGEPLA